MCTGARRATIRSCCTRSARQHPRPGCAECASSPLERVLFPAAIRFKGPGFHSNDYATKSPYARKAS